MQHGCLFVALVDEKGNGMTRIDNCNTPAGSWHFGMFFKNRNYRCIYVIANVLGIVTYRGNIAQGKYRIEETDKKQTRMILSLV